MAYAKPHTLTDAELSDRITRYGEIEQPTSEELFRLADLQSENTRRKKRTHNA